MQEKICSKCKIKKSISDFRMGKVYIPSWCKKCCNSYDRKYRKEHKDQTKKSIKKWLEANRE